MIFLLTKTLPTDGLDAWGKFLYGLQTTALGMGIVFAVLILLWLMLELMGWFFHKRKQEGKEASEAEAPVIIPAAAGIPGEELAAISAALAAYLGGAPATRLVVRSVRRIGKWNRF